MGRFINNEPGVTSYMSDNGYVYSILEGMTVGRGERKTSDIMFVVLDDCNINVDDNIVCWTFGASFFGENEENLEFLDTEVARYEERNRLSLDRILVEDCGDGHFNVVIRYGSYAMVVYDECFDFYDMEYQSFDLNDVNHDCDLVMHGKINNYTRRMYSEEIANLFDEAKACLEDNKEN